MRSGQALVMVLLVLGVASVVGLSVVSRSVSDVSISTTENESSKALEAAEAGVEKALSGATPAPGAVKLNTTIQTGVGEQTSNNEVSRYQVQLSGLSSNSQFYEVPFELDAGNVASLNIAGVSGLNSVCVFWTQATQIEPILYYIVSGAANAAQTVVSNNGSCDANKPSGYSYGAQVNLSALAPSATSYSILRVRTLTNTNPQKFSFWAPQAFPSQGSSITSTGQSGDSTQKIVVKQSNPDLPMMFDAALFSGGSLVQ